MSSFVVLSTLGNFASYRPVFYRVYVPSTDGRGRESVIVVTNFGPVAVLTANAYKRGTSYRSGYDFYALTFVPVTLATLVANNKEDLKKLLDKPRELAKELLRGLLGSINKAAESAQKFARRISREECKKYGANSILVSRVEELSSGMRIVYWEEGRLPAIFEADIGLKLKQIESECGGSEDPPAPEDSGECLCGVIGLALTPLTGSYRTKDDSLVLFRESAVDDVEVFGDALKASFLSILRRAYNHAVGVLGEGHENSRLGLLIDTTHGINNMTSLMLVTLVDALGLMYYDALRKGFSEVTMLFYNSDPLTQQRIGRSDEDYLQATMEHNLSYMYTDVSTARLAVAVDRVDSLVTSDSLKMLPKVHAVDLLTDGLQGLYLLRKGIIPWGLYMLEDITARPLSIRVEDEFNIILELREQKGTLSVGYKLPKRSIFKILYDVILAEWLLEIAADAVAELRRSEHILSPEDSKKLGEVCWGSMVAPRVRCYSIELMKSLVDSDEDKKSKNNKGGMWYKRFLKEVIDPTARIISRHELRELRHEWNKRVKYFAVKALRQDVDSKRSCGEVFGGEEISLGKSRGYYCVTPMVTENEIRHILAHAGLTPVTRYIGLVFSEAKEEELADRAESKCKPIAVCIASKFPEKQLKRIR